jgi:hypothetical protein
MMKDVHNLNKAAVFDALSAAGVTHVAVGFDGEGDSGQIDGAAAHAGDAVVDFPATKVTLHRGQLGREELATQEISLREAVEELCYDHLEREFGGWENNYGAFGEFAFDVAERKLALDINTRFTDHTHYSYTF